MEVGHCDKRLVFFLLQYFVKMTCACTVLEPPPVSVPASLVGLSLF